MTILRPFMMMDKRFPIVALIFAFSAGCGGGEGVDDASSGSEATDTTSHAAQSAPGDHSVIDYPKTKTVDQTDEYHGVSVADPFRWLEDDVRESEEVAAWVTEQSALSSGYLAKLGKREAFKERLQALWDYEKFLLPVKRGDRYFFRRNDGLQNQYVLYAQDGLDGEARQIIDPNGWSADGATALAEYQPSPDGAMVAYTIQDGGSDWRTIKVLNAENGDVADDTVEWVKFSTISWAKDGSGFYYSRYPAPEEGEAFQSLNLNKEVYFHKIGDAQDQDQRIYARPDRPEEGFNATVSSTGEQVFITVTKGTDAKYEVVILDPTGANEPRLIVEGFKNEYSYIATTDDHHFFFTDNDAPRGRIVSTPVEGAGLAEWTEVVAQNDNVLVGASIVGGRMLLTYLEDVKSVVRVADLNGAIVATPELPGIGSAGGFGGQVGDNETFYVFESFNRASTIYRLDLTNLETNVFKQAEAPFDGDDYVVRQVFYTSKDGARIPMFISHRKDLDPSKPAPTLLYGYGGFNISVEPSFSVTRLAWMDMGGVYAVANIRGGGEYGKAWHNAGRLLNKQNVFDDFIAAGEYLIEEGVTSKDKLGVFGGSNGGLLVGAVTNQRPDLFAVAMPAVGVMDMLRFNQFTAGRFWVDDYGDPANEEDFKNLYAYSPYHNIKAGDDDYPAILVITADTDDRVVPGHSFKYAAALQASDVGPEPRLIRIETRAGHGAGKPTEKIIEEYADIWAFMAHHTGL